MWVAQEIIRERMGKDYATHAYMKGCLCVSLAGYSRAERRIWKNSAPFGLGACQMARTYLWVDSLDLQRESFFFFFCKKPKVSSALRTEDWV